MAQIEIIVDEKILKGLVKEYLDRKLGDLSPDANEIQIEVKSQQNYKSEWEPAAFRATYRRNF